MCGVLQREAREREGYRSSNGTGESSQREREERDGGKEEDGESCVLTLMMSSVTFLRWQKAHKMDRFRYMYLVVESVLFFFLQEEQRRAEKVAEKKRAAAQVIQLLFGPLLQLLK